jgi:hypothetical protein
MFRGAMIFYGISLILGYIGLSNEIVAVTDYMFFISLPIPFVFTLAGIAITLKTNSRLLSTPKT